MKKIIAIFSVLALLATIFAFPITSSAAAITFSGGDGTQGTPWLITTAAQLAELATEVNASNTTYNAATVYYKLNANIDLSAYGASFNSGKGWIPIGKNSPATAFFKGSFDGNGKTISNLYINDSTLDYAGLFGRTYYTSGTAATGIKNLILTNVNITAHDNVGGLSGYLANNITTRCAVSGTITGNNYVGGIAGMADVDALSYLYSICSVTGYNEVGGIIGRMEYRGEEIFDCYAAGEVYATVATNGYAAGICPSGSAPVNCVALNSKVSSTSTYTYRIGATDNLGAAPNNSAFDHMLNINNNTTWNNKGADKKDGADITAAQIAVDGTLGGRFTTANGWIIQPGRLPSLFGEVVDIPEYIVNELPAQNTLSINSDPSVAFGTNYTITTTGGSGNGAVSYEIVSGGTGAGSITGNVLTATKPGTITLKAKKAHDNIYQSATSANFTLTVTGKLEQAELDLIIKNAEGDVLIDTMDGTDFDEFYYGEEYFLFTSGGSGTGAVTFEIYENGWKGIGEINGNKLTIIKAGMLNIMAVKAADANYNEKRLYEVSRFNVHKAEQSALSINSSSTGKVGVPYTLTTTGGTLSGGVTYQVVSGPATVSGDVLTITAIGEVVVKATKAGNDNYNNVISENFNITVTKAIQTITIDSNSTHTYGTPYTITSTSSGSGTGAVTYQIVSGGTGVGYLNGDILTIGKAGTIKLKATKAADNDYDEAVSPEFTLTVNKAAQKTLKIGDGVSASNDYLNPWRFGVSGGDGSGALTLTILPGGTGEGSIDEISGYLTVIKSGTFLVKATKAGDDNYLPAESSIFTLTINKNGNPLTVTSPNTHVFGTPYDFTYRVYYPIDLADGVTHYLIKGGTGVGTFEGNVLNITRPGTFILQVTKEEGYNFLATQSPEFTLNVTLPTDYFKFTSIGQAANPTVVYDAGTAVSGKIFLAAYGTNGKLIKVSPIQNIQAGIDKLQQFTGFGTGLSAGCKVKAFAWSDITNTIKPISAPIDIIWQ